MSSKAIKTILILFLIHFFNNSLLAQNESIRSSFIFPFQDQHVHSSSIIELPNGDMLSCWFEGSGERNANDVKVMGARLKKYTENTITSLPALKEHLRTIMKNDYAIDNEEFEGGVRCVSVPIKDYLGVSIAALSITGPACRMTEDVIKNDILPVVKKYTLEISKKLGFDS